MIRRQYDLAFVFRHTGSLNPNATLYNQHHFRPALQLITLSFQQSFTTAHSQLPTMPPHSLATLLSVLVVVRTRFAALTLHHGVWVSLSCGMHHLTQARPPRLAPMRQLHAGVLRRGGG